MNLTFKLILFFQGKELGNHSKKVTVTVFYECLCPDSKSFVLNHLLPSFEKAPHLLKLELIPYGKAEVSVFCLRMMRWVYAVVFSPSVHCYSYRTLIACFVSQQKH